MSTLYITEFPRTGDRGAPQNVAAEVGDSIIEQTVGISGVSAQSNAFNLATVTIRVHSDVICSVKFGLNPTATTASMRFAAGQTEYFTLTPSNSINQIKLAVISNT